MNVNLNVSTNDYLQQYNKKKLEELNRTPAKEIGTVEDIPQELKNEQRVNASSQDQKTDSGRDYEQFKREEVEKRSKEYSHNSYQEKMGTRIDISI